MNYYTKQLIRALSILNNRAARNGQMRENTAHDLRAVRREYSRDKVVAMALTAAGRIS